MHPQLEDVKTQLPQKLPIKYRAEVLVVGGGPGGMGAAVAAAREGRDVLLVEHYGFLGGMATAGEVNPFMMNHYKGVSLDKGVYTDWLAKMEAYGSFGPGGRVFDPHVARLAAEDLCLEAGVRLLFHHRVAQVITHDRAIAGVILHSKSGFTAVQADIYIDATGDGDVAALAGNAFEYGAEGSPYVQPMTLCFKMKLDERDLPAAMIEAQKKQPTASVREWFGPYFQQIQDAYRKAQIEGRIDCPRENVLMFRSVDPLVVHFNTTRVIKKSAIDGPEFSEAEIEARKQLRQYVKLLKDEIPIFKQARLYSIASQIGIRESRRITGRAYVTRNDYLRGATYPDGVVRVTYPIDIHSPTGAGTEMTRLPKDAWYEIPYGCLVPKDIDNLLIACRAISVDHAVHSSMRVMAPVISLGQAAGTAAAMALEQNVAPPGIDGVLLKARLIARGRNLAEYIPDRTWAEAIS